MDGDLFSVSVGADGTLQSLSLGNLTDAGWYWLGDAQDVYIFLARIYHSEASADFLATLDENPFVEASLNRAVQDYATNTRARASLGYHLMGDNAFFAFGGGSKEIMHLVGDQEFDDSVEGLAHLLRFVSNSAKKHRVPMPDLGLDAYYTVLEEYPAWGSLAQSMREVFLEYVSNHMDLKALERDEVLNDFVEMFDISYTSTRGFLRSLPDDASTNEARGEFLSYLIDDDPPTIVDLTAAAEYTVQMFRDQIKDLTLSTQPEQPKLPYTGRHGGPSKRGKCRVHSKLSRGGAGIRAGAHARRPAPTVPKSAVRHAWVAQREEAWALVRTDPSGAQKAIGHPYIYTTKSQALDALQALPSRTRRKYQGPGLLSVAPISLYYTEGHAGETPKYGLPGVELSARNKHVAWVAPTHEGWALAYTGENQELRVIGYPYIYDTSAEAQAALSTLPQRLVKRYTQHGRIQVAPVTLYVTTEGEAPQFGHPGVPVPSKMGRGLRGRMRTYRYYQPGHGWVEGAGLAWAEGKARLGYLVEEFDDATLTWIAFNWGP